MFCLGNTDVTQTTQDMLIVVFRGRYKNQRMTAAKIYFSPEDHLGGFQNSLALEDFVGRALGLYTGQETNPFR